MCHLYNPADCDAAPELPFTGLGSDLSRNPLFTVFLVQCLHSPAIWQLDNTEDCQQGIVLLVVFGLIFIGKKYKKTGKESWQME